MSCAPSSSLLGDPLAEVVLGARTGADADDPRAFLERPVVARLGRVRHRDDVARPGLDLLVAEPEARAPGDDDVELLVAGVGLVVLDVHLVAGVHHDGVDAEVADAEPEVERLPAPVGDGVLGNVGEMHDVAHGPNRTRINVVDAVPGRLGCSPPVSPREERRPASERRALQSHGLALCGSVPRLGRTYAMARETVNGPECVQSASSENLHAAGNESTLRPSMWVGRLHARLMRGR